eukprot:gene3185-biopygen4429
MQLVWLVIRRGGGTPSRPGLAEVHGVHGPVATPRASRIGHTLRAAAAGDARRVGRAGGRGRRVGVPPRARLPAPAPQPPLGGAPRARLRPPPAGGAEAAHHEQGLTAVGARFVKRPVRSGRQLGCTHTRPAGGVGILSKAGHSQVLSELRLIRFHGIRVLPTVVRTLVSTHHPPVIALAFVVTSTASQVVRIAIWNCRSRHAAGVRNREISPARCARRILFAVIFCGGWWVEDVRPEHRRGYVRQCRESVAFACLSSGSPVPPADWRCVPRSGSSVPQPILYDDAMAASRRVGCIRIVHPECHRAPEGSGMAQSPEESGKVRNGTGPVSDDRSDPRLCPMTKRESKANANTHGRPEKVRNRVSESPVKSVKVRKSMEESGRSPEEVRKKSGKVQKSPEGERRWIYNDACSVVHRRTLTTALTAGHDTARDTADGTARDTADDPARDTADDPAREGERAEAAPHRRRRQAALPAASCRRGRPLRAVASSTAASGRSR